MTTGRSILPASLLRELVKDLKSEDELKFEHSDKKKEKELHHNIRTSRKSIMIMF